MTVLDAPVRSGAWRPVFFVPAGLCLLAGLDAAMMLLDLPAPVEADRLPEVHGFVLVLGFVGTLIALERTIALGERWGMVAPALLGLGALLTLAPSPLLVGQLALVAGALSLVAVYLPLWRRQEDEAVLVQALGAVLAAGAAWLWAGGVEVPVLLPWLVAFVVLTIAGERLELARLNMGANAGAVLVLLAVCVTVGVVASLLAPQLGSVLLGVTLAVLVAWLATHDVARRTVRSSGLPRYVAVCMLTAYVWAAVAAGVWLVSGPADGDGVYDAVVHAVFLGFTLSMVMAHALYGYGARACDLADGGREGPAVPPEPVSPGRAAARFPADADLARRWTRRAARVAAGSGTQHRRTAVVPGTGRGQCRGRGPAMRRGFSPWRDLPALVWLMAIPVVAVAHPWLPEPRWLLLHLLLLGAVTHSIVVWSQHFADALLHVTSTPRPQLLAMLALGALAVMVGTQTSLWPVTLVGATSVAGAVIWHALRLAGQLRRALPGRFAGVIHYYLAAALLLPIGAALGVLLAWGLPDPWHSRLLLAHVVVNLLGWVGLTVAGTVLTLWPTMLRTRLGEGSDSAVRRALPLLLVGILTTAGACLAGLWPLAAAGLVFYVVGALFIARPLLDAARRKPPSSHPTWSVGAGLVWLGGCLVAWAVLLARGGTAEEVLGRLDGLVPFLAAGFAAQVLLGALGYLVPTALGGGGRAVRAAAGVLDRAGALRVVVVNAGLLACLLPGPSAVRVGCSLAVLMALASQVPLLVLAIRASRRARGPDATAVAPVVAGRSRQRSLGSAVAGLAVVVLTIAGGVALDPAALDTGRVISAAAGVTATGHTTTVRVEAADMRFVPSQIDVTAGDRLVIELVNTDSDVHDLVLETGADSGRLSPGGRTRLDVGVVGSDLDGWCSIVGHRQMGMTLQVTVTESAATTAADEADGGVHADHSDGTNDVGTNGDNDATYNPAAEPETGFTSRSAVLAPLRDRGPQTHHVTLKVREVLREVAPGVTQRLWTYNGQSPGPILHGRVGDRFVVRLINDATMGHSIDFHAGTLAPDEPMRTIPPGESLTYRFTADRAGIWMYHCSTMPMSAHIANGMFGAVVIEPPDLPAVDQSFVLVQSEQYYGPQGAPVDVDKVQAEEPDAVVFNGYVNQYDHDPMQVSAGDRLRIWVLDAGPNRATAFHVVGGQFTTTWAEGSYLLRDGGADGTGGAQALALAPAQGGFVELTLSELGHYPFVSHVMVDAERGAHGLLSVERP